uniref:Uncharacterized protein n=1 Tax=Oryza glaberrima TaxID=4538 RepID=I1QN09_ORYGL
MVVRVFEEAVDIVKEEEVVVVGRMETARAGTSVGARSGLGITVRTKEEENGASLTTPPPVAAAIVVAEGDTSKQEIMQDPKDMLSKVNPMAKEIQDLEDVTTVLLTSVVCNHIGPVSFTVFARYLEVLGDRIIYTIDQVKGKGLNLFTGGRQREKRRYG